MDTSTEETRIITSTLGKSSGSFNTRDVVHMHDLLMIRSELIISRMLEADHLAVVSTVEGGSELVSTSIDIEDSSGFFASAFGSDELDSHTKSGGASVSEELDLTNTSVERMTIVLSEFNLHVLAVKLEGLGVHTSNERFVVIFKVHASEDEIIATNEDADLLQIRIGSTDSDFHLGDFVAVTKVDNDVVAVGTEVVTAVVGTNTTEADGISIHSIVEDVFKDTSVEIVGEFARIVDPGVDEVKFSGSAVTFDVGGFDVEDEGGLIASDKRIEVGHTEDVDGSNLGPVEDVGSDRVADLSSFRRIRHEVKLGVDSSSLIESKSEVVVIAAIVFSSKGNDITSLGTSEGDGVDFTINDSIDIERSDSGHIEAVEKRNDVVQMNGEVAEVKVFFVLIDKKFRVESDFVLLHREFVGRNSALIITSKDDAIVGGEGMTIEVHGGKVVDHHTILFETVNVDGSSDEDEFSVEVFFIFESIADVELVRNDRLEEDIGEELVFVHVHRSGENTFLTAIIEDELDEVVFRKSTTGDGESVIGILEGSTTVDVFNVADLELNVAERADDSSGNETVFNRDFRASSSEFLGELRNDNTVGDSGSSSSSSALESNNITIMNVDTENREGLVKTLDDSVRESVGGSNIVDMIKVDSSVGDEALVNEAITNEEITVQLVRSFSESDGGNVVNNSVNGSILVENIVHGVHEVESIVVATTRTRDLDGEFLIEEDSFRIFKVQFNHSEMDIQRQDVFTSEVVADEESVFVVLGNGDGNTLQVFSKSEGVERRRAVLVVTSRDVDTIFSRLAVTKDVEDLGDAFQDQFVAVVERRELFDGEEIHGDVGDEVVRTISELPAESERFALARTREGDNIFVNTLFDEGQRANTSTDSIRSILSTRTLALEDPLVMISFFDVVALEDVLLGNTDNSVGVIVGSFNFDEDGSNHFIIAHPKFSTVLVAEVDT